MDLVISTVSQGLLWALLAIGVYLTFRVLDIADLTVEGSFPLGAATAATLQTAGYHPIAANLAASAAGMLHQRSMPLWVSGLLGTIAIVPAVLLLIISIAGLSLAGTLLCGVIGIALMSSAFAGCAIARMVGHNQNRYAMAAVGGVIAGALTGLPLVGDFISGVAFVFMLGYIIQIIWRNARVKPQQAANTPGLPSA